MTAINLRHRWTSSAFAVAPGGGSNNTERNVSSRDGVLGAIVSALGWDTVDDYAWGSFLHGNGAGEWSWVLLEHPTLGSQLVFHCNNSNHGVGTLAFSAGGLFTGGSSTARPTAADEKTLSASIFGNASITSANGAFGGIIVSQSSTGGGNRVFWGLVDDVGQNWAGCLLFETVAGPSGWTVPVVFYPGMAANSGNLVRARATTAVSWFGNGTAGYLGTLTEGVAYTLINVSAVNPIANEWPVAEVKLTSAATGATGAHGRIDDLWFGSESVNGVGVKYNSGAQLGIGCFVIPWDGSASPVETTATIRNGLNAPLAARTSDTASAFSVNAEPVAPDVTAPTIANVAPTAGTAIASGASVQFDATDVGGLRRILIKAAFAGVPGWELVYDGSAFSSLYSAASTCTAITNGYRFVLRRANGWPAAPTFTPYAIDQGGNENA